MTIYEEPSDTTKVLAASDFDDLTAAASSNLDFWDNPLDDEDWHDAPAHVREKPCP